MSGGHGGWGVAEFPRPGALLLPAQSFVPVVTSGYSANALQFFSRITDPGTSRKDAYAAIIDSLTSSGVWAKLDALYILAADISGNAIVNLVSSSYGITVNGSPTFTADQGYNANGTGGNYLDTGLDLSTATNYQQNSAHLSVWSRTSAQSGVQCIGQPSAGATISIHTRFSDDNCYSRINDGSPAGGTAVATAISHTIGNRSGASAWQVYRDGSSLGSGSDASGALSGGHNLLILTGNTGNASSNQVAVASAGASLSATDASNFYTALNTNKWW